MTLQQDMAALGVLALAIFVLGFAIGYATRAEISRRRRIRAGQAGLG